MRHPHVRVVTSLLALGLVAVAVAPGSIYAQPVDSVAVANEWVTDLASGNFSGALDLLDDDSSLIVSTAPDGEIASYANKNEIAGVLQGYGADETKVKLVDPPHDVLGTVTWTEQRSSDSLRKLGLRTLEVAADALIEGGKIRSLVYELTPASAARLAKAQSSRYPPLGMPRTGTQDVTQAALLALFGAATLFSGLGIYLSRRKSPGPN